MNVRRFLTTVLTALALAPFALAADPALRDAVAKKIAAEYPALEAIYGSSLISVGSR